MMKSDDLAPTSPWPPAQLIHAIESGSWDRDTEGLRKKPHSVLRALMDKSRISVSKMAHPHPIYPSSPSHSNIPIHSFAATDIGHRRTRNEDYFSVDDTQKIYLLADGMGGGPHGDFAAHLAVDTIHQALEKNAKTAQSSERLEEAIQRGRTEICKAIRRDPECIGMGTTVVGLLLENPHQAVVAHVGDSRAYRLRKNRLELLTQDHTMAAALHAEGHLSEAEATNHRLSHVLTRALCRDAICDVEVKTTSVVAGDIFLLCSDGLNNMVTDSEIHSCLVENGATQETCDRLIHAALRHGGRDNITVILVEILNNGRS
jgi:protein phosphatase